MAKLDHVAVQVADLDAAIAFYTEKLGLKLMFREMSAEHHEAFAFIELEGGNLELLQTLDDQNRPKPYAPPTIQPPYCPHVALQTDDMDALIADLDAKGIAIVKGPLEIPGSVRWLYLADPNNNVVEYVQWVSQP